MEVCTVETLGNSVSQREESRYIAATIHVHVYRTDTLFGFNVQKHAVTLIAYTYIVYSTPNS